jgi:hypothetical protein
MELSRQFFFSLLSMIRAHTVSLGKKKETKQEAGRVLPTGKGFENGVPDHIFLSFFP